MLLLPVGGARACSDGGPVDRRPASAACPPSSTSTAPSTSGSPSTAQVSRATVPALTFGMSTASTHTRSGARRKRSIPARMPAAGPPSGGILAGPGHRPAGRDLVADHDDLDRRAGSRPAPARAASRRPTSIEALSMPSIRAAVPPVRITAPSRRGSLMRSVWQAEPDGHPGRLPGAAVVEPRPRARTAPRSTWWPRSAPAAPVAPGRVPRGVRPRLRQARLGGRRLRRAAGRPVRDPAGRARRRPRRHAGRRDVRGQRRPGPAVQHPRGGRPGRAARVVPQDPPLRLLRLPGVRPAQRRRRSSRWWSTCRAGRSG